MNCVESASDEALDKQRIWREILTLTLTLTLILALTRITNLISRSYGHMSAVWSSGLSTGLVINMVWVHNPLAPFCCFLGKDTLRHFPLLGDLSKQF